MSDDNNSTRHHRDDTVAGLGLERMRALLAEYYRRQGYRVDAFDAAPGGDADDASIDLQLHRDDSRLLVRCMHWNDTPVPHLRVRAWEDVLAGTHADSAILATSGEFTASAVRTASVSKTIRLVDGTQLRKMLMPLLSADAGFGADGAAAAFAEAAAEADAAPTPSAVSSDAYRDAAPEVGAAGADTPERGPREDDAAERHAGPRRADAPLGVFDAAVGPAFDDGSAPDAHRTPPFAADKRAVWERGQRPASMVSFAVASVLLTLIVLTIVFRHRLDPYLGDPPRPAAVAPRNESPLAGTDYKSDVFAPVIPPQSPDTPPEQAPKPNRPAAGAGEPPRAEEAIRVIAPSTPEMWPEEQRRKAAADAPPKR